MTSETELPYRVLCSPTSWARVPHAVRQRADCGHDVWISTRTLIGMHRKKVPFTVWCIPCVFKTEDHIGGSHEVLPEVRQELRGLGFTDEEIDATARRMFEALNAKRKSGGAR